MLNMNLLAAGFSDCLAISGLERSWRERRHEAERLYHQRPLAMLTSEAISAIFDSQLKDSLVCAHHRTTNIPSKV